MHTPCHGGTKTVPAFLWLKFYGSRSKKPDISILKVGVAGIGTWHRGVMFDVVEYGVNKGGK